MRSCMVDAELNELVDVAAERSTAKRGGWSSYQLWKTTIDVQPGSGLIERPVPLAQRLDAEEDRVLIRAHKHYARRVLIVLLVLVASSMFIYAERHRMVSSTPQDAGEVSQPPHGLTAIQT